MYWMRTLCDGNKTDANLQLPLSQDRILKMFGTNCKGL